MESFLISRPLFLLTRKFINDLIKTDSCLFAKCGTQMQSYFSSWLITEDDVIMVNVFRLSSKYSSLLFCYGCVLFLNFELLFVLILINWEMRLQNKDSRNLSCWSKLCKTQSKGKEPSQISVCWPTFSVIKIEKWQA